MPLNVGLFAYENVEVLDFAGPFEVFTTASRVHFRLAPDEPEPFVVTTISPAGLPVRARAGLLITPDFAIHDHPPLDILIIPGGVVTELLAQRQVIDWIAGTSARTQLTASVCTGAFLLAAAGLLDRRSATTHWEDLGDLREMFPSVDVQENVRWIDEGTVVTSAGISAGIDMSLHLVERTLGRPLALRTARQLEFDWTENRRHPDTADIQGSV